MSGKSISQATIEARVVRANGKVENLGVIARYDKSLLKRLLRKVKING